jgi:hypothetical protein
MAPHQAQLGFLHLSAHAARTAKVFKKHTKSMLKPWMKVHILFSVQEKKKCQSLWHCLQSCYSGD